MNKGPNERKRNMEKMMRKIVFTGVAIFMAVPLLGLGGSFSRVSCNVAS